MCVFGIKPHQHASVFVCMFTWEKCLIHTSHSNYFNVRKKNPKQTSRWCFYFWRPHRKRVRTRVSLTVVGVVPERAVKSCSGSDLKSDNLRWRVLFMCLLFALPGSLDGGDSCGSEPTAVRFSLAGTSPTAVRCQVSLDTQGHFNSTVATLAFFLSIEEIQRVFLRLSDVARFCKHGQKRRLMPPPPPHLRLMMFLSASSLHVVPAPLPLPKGQTNGDVKEISCWLSMRSSPLWHRSPTSSSSRRLLPAERQPRCWWKWWQPPLHQPT